MHAAAARTTSMLASAALLGALAFAGLTMTFSFTPPDILDRIPPITVAPHDPPAPPPVSHVRTPPQTHVEQTPAETPLPVPAPDPAPVAAPQPTGWSPPAVPTIVSPHWLRQPRNLQSYYPRRALQRSVEGVAQLDCRVTTTGTLQCAVISETPMGWDFGEAALRIARDYQMTPAMRDGVPVEARYQMRVPFRLN